MSRIAALEASVHRIPLTPLLFDRPRHTLDVVLCRVVDGDGREGWGLTGRFLAQAVALTLDQVAAPVVTGYDVHDVEAIHVAFAASVNPRGQGGVAAAALSALDIALWDLAGQEAGRSIARMLGGCRTEVPTYVTFGPLFYDADQLVDCARHFLDQGFRGLKMEVGIERGGWRADVERVRRVREAVGPDVDLMIDANGKFSIDEARILCRHLAGLDIRFFEEPIWGNDPSGLAELRRVGGIPVAAGQMEPDLERFGELIAAGALDIVQPNCCYNGGFTVARKVTALAQAHRLAVDIGGGWPYFNLHLLAGACRSGSVEFHALMAQATAALFGPLPEAVKGVLSVPDAPGLGFRPDPDALRETRVGRS